MGTPDSFTFTVGKLDAGMAILLGDRAHLIEFPSVLLPPGATTGSIVNIAVHQNVAAEKKRDEEFWALQHDILETFGKATPVAPRLEVRNTTHTSVALEWPTIELATAKLRSLDIYKNGQRLSAIPNALTNTSTKLSGLSLDTEYTFQLVLRTTAGTFPSNVIKVRTHTIENTSGIRVCFGTVGDLDLLGAAKDALEEMGGKWSDKIEIDTTHFVCTTPAVTPAGAQAGGNAVTSGGPGVEYQRALQLSIPVVQPQWLLTCQSQKRMVPIAGFYLGVTPPAASKFSSNRPQSMSQSSLPGSSSTNLHKTGASRMSMPVQSSSLTSNTNNSLSNGKPNNIPGTPTPPSSAAKAPPFGALPEETEEHEHSDIEEASASSPPVPKEPLTQSQSRHRSNGTMDRNFKFPPDLPASQTSPPPPVPAVPAALTGAANSTTTAPHQAPDVHDVPVQSLPIPTVHIRAPTAEGEIDTVALNPASVEVPPPPPVEKERRESVHGADEDDEDVGPTVEIDLR